jgi:outer membrane protein
MILYRCASGGAMALAFLLATGATDVQAQAPGAPTSFGPPIAGLCVFSTNGVLAESSAGKAFSERINQLKQQVATELQPQEAELASEAQALQRSATPDQAKMQAFAAKRDQFYATRQQRLEQLEYTGDKEGQRILLEARPVLNQVFQQKNCSILLQSDNVVMVASPAMDLTPAVILGLNSRMQTITFDLESPPAESGAPAGGR